MSKQDNKVLNWYMHTECDIVMMVEMFFHVLDRVFNSTTEQKIDLRRPTEINTQEELHTQKRMQFDKVLITMGITLESSKIKISIVIALAILHLLCTF